MGVMHKTGIMQYCNILQGNSTISTLSSKKRIIQTLCASNVCSSAGSHSEYKTVLLVRIIYVWSSQMLLFEVMVECGIGEELNCSSNNPYNEVIIACIFEDYTLR